MTALITPAAEARARSRRRMESKTPQTTPHMHDRFERFFGPHFMLGLNLAVIIAAETLGGGRLLYDTGYIHVPALVFLFLAAVRIFGRYRIYDPASRRFLGWSLAALALLLLSHGIEFVDQDLDLGWPAETVYGAVFTIHLSAFLAVTVGASPILKAFGKVRSAITWAAISTFVVLVATIESLAVVAGLISSVPPFLYVAIALVAGVAAVAPTLAVAKVVPALENFSSYLTGALVFSTAAAGLEALHLIVGGNYFFYQQVTYLSLFAFYGALSLLFLAFGKLANSGGAFDIVATPQAREVRGAARSRQ